VERDRYYRVETFIHRNGLREKTRQMAPQRFHPGVLIKVNQIAKGALIKAEAGRAIEAPKAGTAHRAKAMLIQRKPVQKRGVAGGTKIFRFEGLRSVEALLANRGSGPADQRTLADAAFVREKQRKDSVG
jgi:hypothetical protein